MPQTTRLHAVTARQALTMVPGAAPVDDAALLLEGRRILDVGPRRSVLAGFTGPVTDLGEVVLLPGLINAHARHTQRDVRRMDAQGNKPLNL